MAEIPIDVEELNRWRKAYEVLRASLWELGLALHTGNIERSKELVEQIHAGSDYIALRLMEAGAEAPLLPTDVPPALLGSSANREYASRLRAAWESAIAVDIERDIHPEGRAAILEAMLREVEVEIQNAQFWGEAPPDTDQTS